MNRHILVHYLFIILAIIFMVTGTASFAQRGGNSTRPEPQSANDVKQQRINMRQRGVVARAGGMRFGMLTTDTPKESKVKGSLVVKIMPYSIAENAGISQGDIIVEINGVQVTSEEQLMKIVPNLAEDTNHIITIVRENDRMNVSINLAENTTIYTPVVPAKRGLTDINTLKYALIDPKTRIVTFIGSYDPAYATGPIPYANILRDVLPNPYPSISIEPSADQRADFDKVDKMISADIARMNSDANYCNEWGQKLSNLLLYDTSLTVDNKRFFKNCGAALGMTGEELKNLYSAASGQTQMSQSESFSMLAKLMRGVGLQDVANAMQAMSGGGTPDDAIRGMCEAMGIAPQLDELQKKLNEGMTYDKFKSEGIILAMSAMCRRFGAPESELKSRVASIRSGAENASVMTNYFAEQMANFITTKAGARMLNGLVLSPELMSKIYNLPVPKSNLAMKNIPSNSHLGDALFRADYLLKTLCTNPDVREKVTGHLTDQEFLQKEAAARNYNLPAGAEVGIGNRLVPAEVKMRVSPNGDVVEFQNSQVKVISWVRELSGKAKSGAAADFVNSTTPKYGEFLTANYDKYAKAYPELHKMSEVAKCVALARWAKSNNYTINIDNASNEKVPLPRQIPGFWTAVFHTDGERAFLTVVEQGGASFSQDEGEAWIKPQQDETVSSDVCKQLVASTVLAEKALKAITEDGDLEAARELADKSARAMTGDIDLNMLPALSDIPMPGEPAIYAAADAELINQASECLNTMKNVQQDLQRAQDLQSTNPQEAEKLRQQATQTQDNAQARLKELLASVSSVKADPSIAGTVVASLKNSSSAGASAGGVASGGQAANQGTTTTPAASTSAKEDWPAKVARLKAELEMIDKKIAATRESLLRLSATIQDDRKQYEQWEKDADDAFDRCVNTAGDVAVDFGAGGIADRYSTIHGLAKKLPDEPTDLIEKYRLLASLAARMKEAKSVNDFKNLAAKENLTEAELYETLRDGVGQIVGLLELDKTVPGKFWKYGSLAVDMAYNLTELSLGWENVTALEGNTELQLQAVKKLAEQMRLLVESKIALRKQIDAGE
ncbi:MAG: PDZ domain-containing protein [Armatimonadota bacterium]